MVQGLRLCASNAGAWVRSLAREVLHAAWCGPPPPKKKPQQLVTTWMDLESESESHSVVSDSLQPHGCNPPGSSVHRDSPGKNTWTGCHALLQGIFPTQGLNSGVPHFRLILYHLSHERSPRILQWVAYPFSRGTFWPRNRTRVSCTASRFFTSWILLII